MACYDQLYHEIRLGKTTWEQAEASGLVLPASKAGQRRWAQGRWSGW
jgi:hypothetical protein